MYTKPSVDDLLEGVKLTIENALLPGLESSPDLQRITLPILNVLDRISREWSVKSSLLAEDTIALVSLIREVAALAAETSEGKEIALIAEQQAAPSPSADTGELADANNAAGEALIKIMEILDLPAAPGADGVRQQIDGLLRAGLIGHAERELSAIPVLEISAVQANMNKTMAAEAIGDMPDRLAVFLENELAREDGGLTPGSVRVIDFERMPGGASRDTYLFSLAYQDASGAELLDDFVLQREAVSSLLDTDGDEVLSGNRRRPEVEFAVVREMAKAGILVPKMLWCDATGEFLDRPFVISRKEAGTTSDVELRAGDPAALTAVFDDFVTTIAQIHDVDPGDYDLALLGASTPAEVAREQVDCFEASYRRHALEPHPGIEYLLRWLKKNAPVASEICIIHGDYRRGNFLIDGDRVTSYIDWEQVHLGDPLEDLAFIYWSHWTLEPVMPLDDFLARYEQARGVTVDREALAYYRLFIEFKMLVIGVTGFDSFYATANRQLAYINPYFHTFTTECYLRTLRELDSGGPRYDFPAAADATVLY